MSRQRLTRWSVACWSVLRDGLGGASLSLSIQAQLPAQRLHPLFGAPLTGEQP